MFGDGYVFPLSPVQIQCVLGIPMGSRQVPSKTPEDDDVKAEVKRINGLFTKGDNISLLVAGAAMFRCNSNAELVPLRSEAEKSHFKIAFLIVVLGYLLCPTTNTSKLAALLTPVLSVYKETAEHDWCSWTLDWLCVAANKFQKKFTSKGYVAGSGGCLLFLLLFYIDHLRRVSVQWGVMPRNKVWTPKKISEALNADKYPKGDYGKLKSMNVAYGEPHPLGCRDSSKTDVDQITALVAERITPQLMSTIDEKLNTVIQSMQSMNDMLTRSFGTSGKVKERIDNGITNESAVETGNIGSLDRDIKSVCDAVAQEYQDEDGGLDQTGYDGVDQGEDHGLN